MLLETIIIKKIQKSILEALTNNKSVKWWNFLQVL